MITPKDVSDAWHSITDEWIVRRNKAHDSKQWEVVHDWGGDVISEETRKVLQRFDIMQDADCFAWECENEARGAAVLALLTPDAEESSK